MAQKRGMKGSKGSWKEFLSVFDKKFGSSLSDPTRRSTDALAAFLNTFSQKDDLKVINLTNAVALELYIFYHF